MNCMLTTAVITALQSERYTDTQSYIPSESFRLSNPMISIHYLHGHYSHRKMDKWSTLHSLLLLT